MYSEMRDDRVAHAWGERVQVSAALPPPPPPDAAARGFPSQAALSTLGRSRPRVGSRSLSRRRGPASRHRLGGLPDLHGRKGTPAQPGRLQTHVGNQGHLAAHHHSQPVRVAQAQAY